MIAVGVNCTAPADVAPLLERIGRVTELPLVAYPNGGQSWDAAGKAWRGSPSGFSGADLTAWVELGAGYAGRVDKSECQVATVDRKPAATDGDVRRGEDEVVEASRLKRAHLRSRRACVSACESLSTTRMADDRRRVDRLWPTEDLVSPGVVVVGMRVDDEEAPRVLCRAAQRRELQRERGSAVRVDDDEPARGLDDELSTSSSQRNRRRRGSRPSGASVSSFE